MNNRRFSCLSLFLMMLIGAGCANIVPPAGGDKDVQPPKLVSVSPADSQRNVRTAKIRFDFDEYIALSDAATQVIISPLLPVVPTVTALNKHVTITFPDSLLQENTTYHVSLGTAVRDNHEGNIYRAPDYLFSTGSYFDSLKCSGRVINAATGLPDTAATVLLYAATESDSAIVRHKPLYAVHTDRGGRYTFLGLPKKAFHLFALQDKNGNLVFDDPAEWIGFADQAITPDSSFTAPELQTFPRAGADTLKPATTAAPQRDNVVLPSYTVGVDTSDAKRRTKDVTRPLTITFARKPSLVNKEKLFLTFDSTGITTEAVLQVQEDTARPFKLLLETHWAEDAVYTLRLQKGFAKDSAGGDLLPGRYTFRTKREEDYARLSIHLPTKYYGTGFVLQVSNETDTIYQKPVTDSMVDLRRIAPGNYRLRVIEDRNRNGHWDTGDLFGKKQPERVISYDQVILLKPGWENQVDFEREPAPEKKSLPKSPGASLK